MVRVRKIVKGSAPVKSNRNTTSKKTVSKSKLYKIDMPMPKRQIKMRDILIYFDKKYKGNWDDIMGAIERKERVDNDTGVTIADEELEKYDIVTMIDEDFPDRLKRGYKPPFVVKKKKGSKGGYKDEEIR